MDHFYLENFGCRATQADGAALERELLNQGLLRADDPKEAQVVVLNTCTVTSSADQDARSTIRRIHRQNPGAKILVTGCYAQRAPEEIAQIPGVSMVVGNSHKHRLAEIANNRSGFVALSSLETTKDIFVGDIFAHTELMAAPVFEADTASEKTRPNLKVQDGCNNRCSFCIIPYVRGKSRSLKIEDVVRETRALVDLGYKEVVLSGINLGRWGRDLTSAAQASDSDAALNVGLTACSNQEPEGVLKGHGFSRAVQNAEEAGALAPGRAGVYARVSQPEKTGALAPGRAGVYARVSRPEKIGALAPGRAGVYARVSRPEKIGALAPEVRRLRFVDLLRTMLSETDIQKIRISSVEPMDWTDELIELVATSSRICKHAHVPLQSGSDRILRRMHRKYRPWHYADRINKIRAAMPDAAIGADVMVGFPGETDEQFEETRAFIDSLPFTYLHVFTYSSRPGTPTATMPDQVRGDVTRERNRILRELAAKKKHEFQERFVGRDVDAITLTNFQDGRTEALTDNYQKLWIDGRHEANQLVRVTVAAIEDESLAGHISKRC